ncbi:MAG: hypothetical protein ABF968_12785 [Acetobacter sp.]|uniref:hypothetical protein n=1 Tax=Acetobacter sp. TaxID=440 RepID=UPI0039EA9058
MAEALLPAPNDSRIDDHEQRISVLEQDRTATRQEIAALQLRLVEVQTEGRMRGERQDVDLRDLKGMTRDLLGGMAFFKAAFTWAVGAVGAFLIFIAIWGPKLLAFWRDWHHV